MPGISVMQLSICCANSEKSVGKRTFSNIYFTGVVQYHDHGYLRMESRSHQVMDIVTVHEIVKYFCFGFCQVVGRSYWEVKMKK